MSNANAASATLQPRLARVTCAHPGGLHQLAYREWFDPSHGDRDSAPVVVCVHGLTRLSNDFDALARALAQRGWRVVCPDMIGRGDSDRVADPMLYGVPQYVADCVALVARLGVEQIDWVGTSMGGLIGMTYAALKGNPIRRMVLNDIGPQLDWLGLDRIATYVGQVPLFASIEEGMAWLRVVMASFGPHDEAGWELLTRPYLRPAPGGGWTAHYDPAIAEPFRIMMASADRQSVPPSMWHLWEMISAPTLVLRGAESDLLSVETCQTMQSRGPKTRVIEFPGVGHAPTMIAPDQIEPVLAFLSES